MKRTFLIGTILTSTAVMAGCGDDTPKPSQQAQSAPAAPRSAASGAGDHAGHDHADHAKTDDHANRVDLGTKKVGGLELKASQDEPVKAGGEGAFDLIITGGKPKAVRFWVGTEDAKGSLKAKAEEKEETPDNWHTHVEVPDPLPAGSKFCAEIEPPTGSKFTVSFDFKQQQ
jgi:hypothetical protein